jgi:hypothetical protein
MISYSVRWHFQRKNRTENHPAKEMPGETLKSGEDGSAEEERGISQFPQINF